MTAPKPFNLKALCEEAGEPFDDSITKTEASRRIDALQAKTGRGRTPLRNLARQGQEDTRHARSATKLSSAVRRSGSAADFHSVPVVSINSLDEILSLTRWGGRYSSPDPFGGSRLFIHQVIDSS
jgi:hypothetical protein